MVNPAIIIIIIIGLFCLWYLLSTYIPEIGDITKSILEDLKMALERD